MFDKKKCKRCREKINSKHRYCPNCGDLIDSKNEDWGMLGRNDFISSNDRLELPMGFNTIFNSLIKNLNKQLELDKETERGKPKIQKKTGISISISTAGNKPPEIKINSFGDGPKFKQQKPIKDIILPANLSQKEFKKISSLPKKEPLTKIRRLSNKVIYEIEMPGVKSIKDISIAKFENSIEIKALAKDKAYFKVIPINLPITNYNLSKGRLILELGTKS